MDTAADKERVSFALYAADVAALDHSAEALRKVGLDLERNDLIRALVHLTSESELARLGALRLTQDEASGGKDVIAERLTVRILKEDLKKLDRAGAKISDKDLRSHLVRTLLQANPLQAFVRELQAFTKDFPDGRALRWQKREP